MPTFLCLIAQGVPTGCIRLFVSACRGQEAGASLRKWTRIPKKLEQKEEFTPELWGNHTCLREFLRPGTSPPPPGKQERSGCLLHNHQQKGLRAHSQVISRASPCAAKKSKHQTRKHRGCFFFPSAVFPSFFPRFGAVPWNAFNFATLYFQALGRAVVRGPGASPGNP